MREGGARSALVLGAAGLSGRAICLALRRSGWAVTAAGRGEAPPGETAWRRGDVRDDAWVQATVQGHDVFLYFVATTVPSTSRDDPAEELTVSLPVLRGVLEVISRTSPCRFVFPSSGGAIYGPRATPALETDEPEPTSAYALGKLMAEEMVSFYGRTRGLNYDILRITNVYGSPEPRRTPQGVIDVFLDNATAGRRSAIWSPLSAERDYIFVDDVADAVATLLDRTPAGARRLNLGSGRLHTLAEVLAVVDEATGSAHAYLHDDRGYQGVIRSPVDTSAFQRLTRWTPCWSLKDGVAESWRRKAALHKAAGR